MDWAALDYNFDKVQIKAGSYYPSGYEETENDNSQIRKLWLEILKGNKKLPMIAEVYPTPGAVEKQNIKENV